MISMCLDYVTSRNISKEKAYMDVATLDINSEQWGVVYSYGSVLATFENEQDAQNEALCFNGAVVRIARSAWSTICDAGVVPKVVD